MTHCRKSGFSNDCRRLSEIFFVAGSLGATVDEALAKAAGTHCPDDLIDRPSKKARVLLHQPEVIILGEPTIGLDPQQVRGIRDLLEDVKREHTMAVATHSLLEDQQVCDRVLVINNGRIIVEDTPEELRTSEPMLVESVFGPEWPLLELAAGEMSLRGIFLALTTTASEEMTLDGGVYGGTSTDSALSSHGTHAAKDPGGARTDLASSSAASLPDQTWLTRGPLYESSKNLTHSSGGLGSGQRCPTGWIDPQPGHCRSSTASAGSVCGGRSVPSNTMIGDRMSHSGGRSHVLIGDLSSRGLLPSRSLGTRQTGAHCARRVVLSQGSFVDGSTTHRGEIEHGLPAVQRREPAYYDKVVLSALRSAATFSGCSSLVCVNFRKK